jgi:hypothetical protein|tara:strand:- start:2233 stop:2706 length:474 start_codon:yes stop_codon:yes gene_type:complete
MGIKINYTDVTGQNTVATIERLSDNYFWNNSLNEFEVSVEFSNKKIAMIEGSNENIGTYTGTNNGNLGTGDFLVRIHDLDNSNVTVASDQVSVVDGEESNATTALIDSFSTALADVLGSLEITVSKSGGTAAAQRQSQRKLQRQSQRRQQRLNGPNT